ncbi:hypothetical protein ES703_86661 [subsurface metagenome]
MKVGVTILRFSKTSQSESSKILLYIFSSPFSSSTSSSHVSPSLVLTVALSLFSLRRISMNSFSKDSRMAPSLSVFSISAFSTQSAPNCFFKNSRRFLSSFSGILSQQNANIRLYSSAKVAISKRKMCLRTSGCQRDCGGK